MSEETIRRFAFFGALTMWVIAITLSTLLLAKAISNVDTQGVNVTIFTAQGLAITLTVLWAQLRVRATTVAVMTATIAALKASERNGDKRETTETLADEKTKSYEIGYRDGMKTCERASQFHS